MRHLISFLLAGLLIVATAALAASQRDDCPADRVEILRTDPLVIRVYPPRSAYQPGRPWPEPILYHRPGQDAEAVLVRYWPPR